MNRNVEQWQIIKNAVKSERGVVAAQNWRAAASGADILAKGGNAVDAAVAVGFSLAITLPRAGNLGGGGFMLVYLKEQKEIFYIDYRSNSPLNSNIKDLFGTDLPKEYKKTNFDKTSENHGKSLKFCEQ